MTLATKSKKPRQNSAFKHLMSIHWWMFYCYIIPFVDGAFMARLPRDFFVRGSLYDFHKTVGVLTMGLLTCHPMQVMSREQLLNRIWGYDYNPGSNIVDVYIGHLRRKLGNDLIETVRGVGYRLRG